MPRAFSVFVIATVALILGCQTEPTPPAPAASRLAASKLSILVVDDPPLAAGIKLLRGEWNERTGGQLEIEESSLNQLLAAIELSTDLIIFPSRHVGSLVDRDWLRPLRESVLESADLALNDMFPVIRNVALRYGNQIFGVSLGEPPLILAGNADRWRFDPRKTWQQLEFPLVHVQQPNFKYPRAAELLARSLAFTQHSRRSAFLFDAETMQPKLTRPIFMRALEEQVELESKTPDRGQNELAISFPSSSLEISRDLLPISGLADPPAMIAFRPLPPADEVYNAVRDFWEPKESDAPLAILGYGGRTAGVTRCTRNSASAFKLLTWLVSENVATQLSPRSQATVWFRESQVRKAGKWLEGSSADGETASVVNKLLSSDNYFSLPRIPGIEEYLQTLEVAVQRALSAEAPVENRWRTLQTSGIRSLTVTVATASERPTAATWVSTTNPGGLSKKGRVGSLRGLDISRLLRLASGFTPNPSLTLSP